ncbi:MULTISPECIES: lytic transglycosylase domain-containing protein [Gluconobacter]|uniref:lytic transglycosylase domain-containing protein n=1 Tax=Gluconobacter TaxID=441 RepID=UPI001B8D33CC|nr:MULTISPECIES: lytic transglycosylase domain-containing protein [Gluconobacter]MBS1035649.1 lytic transglycosylase domain-containing protein [Gluconobacter cerinus]
MKARLFFPLALAALMAAPAASAEDDGGRQIAACLKESARNAHVPTGVMLVLLYVEGGHPGQAVQNTNGTSDLGPMQVNTIHVPEIARHWHTTPSRAYAALRNNSCANLEAGGWILGQEMTKARGDLWQAVAGYHSHTPRFGTAYLKRFYEISQTLIRTSHQGDPA